MANNPIDTPAESAVGYRTNVTWTEPKYDRATVDAAGDLFRPGRSRSTDVDQSLAALDVINNWRSAHAFPLNTFQVYLRSRARSIDTKAIVAQRIKRLPAISRKLAHHTDLPLTEIQDVAGCRAIMGSVGQVRKLVDTYKNSSIKHRLVHEDDYIARPRRSGYRSVHLIYCYHSGKKKTYNDMKIEIQIRTRLQHAWATAVETVGLFTGQFLKNNQGDRDWLKFFALMGSAIAIKEGCPTVDRTPKDKGKLYDAIREYEAKLRVIHRLEGYRTALRVFDRATIPGAQYFLLELDPGAKRLSVTPYRPSDLERASGAYLAAERQNEQDTPTSDQAPERDAVLVRVDSARALRRAYPNYFLDTRAFMRELQEAISS